MSKITGKLDRIKSILTDVKTQIMNQTAYILDEVEILEKSLNEDRKKAAIRNIKDSVEYLRGYTEE